MANANEELLQSYIDKYNFIKDLPNVELNFGPVNEKTKHPLEQIYLHGIFKVLSTVPSFGNYQFYVIGSNAPWDFKIDEKSIVFYMSNEKHDIPESLSKAFLVFTPYCPLSSRPKNVFPIPLGYNGSLRDLPVKPINERTIDVFFSGNLHRRRGPFYLGAQLFLMGQKLFGGAKKHNLQVSFGRQFGGGLSPEKYSEVSMNSKIALVPEGYLSNNSFRFFEASKYGTLIITKKLYDYWFYKAFPGYQTNNWIGVGGKIRYLLNHPDKMEEMHRNIRKYYEENCSEKAVAEYIIGKIAEKEQAK